VAREVTGTLIDDLDGGKAAETVTFGLDGRTYEIDLNNKTQRHSASR
jgi:nucleoid-associated protein Lsr2